MTYAGQGRAGVVPVIDHEIAEQKLAEGIGGFALLWYQLSHFRLR